jgi:galactokinase
MLNTEVLTNQFLHRYGAQGTESFFSPGRVNLIGEHIDYNGGFVLPAALSLGITAVVRRRSDDTIRVYSNNFTEGFEISGINSLPNLPRSDGWTRYIVAMLQVIKNSGIQLKGADILIGSDLPLGSGLSSSAALECLIAYIFNTIFYETDRTQLALDAQTAEREYVGVQCGIMDQFIVAHAKKDHAILLNCETLEYDQVPAVFGDYQLVIINSNKPRLLAESKYNERRAECDKALAILRQFDPAENLCNIHPISLAQLTDDVLYRRAKHAITENARVIQAVQALQNGNIDLFGILLTESHQSLAENYEVSCPELDTIVHYATHFEDCAGARMTGAGFGGCCIALVKKENTDRFMTYVGLKYEQKTGLKAEFYLAAMSDGVNRL